MSHTHNTTREKKNRPTPKHLYSGAPTETPLCRGSVSQPNLGDQRLCAPPLPHRPAKKSVQSARKGESTFISTSSAFSAHQKHKSRLAHIQRRGVQLDVAWLLRAVALGAHGAREVFRQKPARVQELEGRLLAPHPLQEKEETHTPRTTRVRCNLAVVEARGHRPEQPNAGKKTERERLNTVVDGSASAGGVSTRCFDAK